MKNRRTFLLGLTSAAVALAIVVVPALADELYGRITKVNVDANTIVVTEKGSDKDVTVKVNDDTVVETPKGERKVDLEKLQKGLEKSEGRGPNVVVTHEKGVASKIKFEFRKKGEYRKKGEGRKDDDDRKKEEPKR
jgi:hypothetical protein